MRNCSLHDRGEPVHAFSEVDRLGRDEHAHGDGRKAHAGALNACRTAAMAAAGAASRIRTMTPCASISISASGPLRRSALRMRVSDRLRSTTTVSGAVAPFRFRLDSALHLFL